MPRRSLIAALAFFVAAVALLLAGLLLWRPMPTPKPPLVVGELPAICRDTGFEGVPYAVCEIDPHRHAVVLARADGNGKPYGSLQAFDTVVTAKGAPVLLAMNAGMYHKGLGPVGLFVEDGRQETPLNTAEGEGNFFLKPNGVFLLTVGREARVLESSECLKLKQRVELATQSGPLLVRHGAIHPKFKPDSTSRLYRNGVGIPSPEVAIFVITRDLMNLHEFARLFRDVLHCPDALYFDGTVSSLYAPPLRRNDRLIDLGPMIGITTERKGN